MPLSCVAGACGSRAERSSDWVRRSRLASGQGCRGRRPARRSAEGASPRGGARPRSVAVRFTSARLPLACSAAVQAGASASSTGWAWACADSG
ncbi:hypothetical protein D621_13125 [beta proteobacterium AAP51]|nr:hypothetical protein D621_13125 [beta proteobacterium AAP51]